MTTLEALHRAILEDPACDTRRLVYADALDETGKPRDAARAELIRVQSALAKVGPKPKRLGEGIAGGAMMSSAGPDYWRFTEAEDYGIVAGERVDVVLHPGFIKKSLGRIAHGLVATRVEDLGSDGVRFTVKRDADSKPWGGEELRSRETDLLKRWGESFLPEPLRRRDWNYPVNVVAGSVVHCDTMDGSVVFNRGFIAHIGVILPWRPDDLPGALERLCGHVRAVFAWNPLESITLSFDGHPAKLTAEITNDHPWFTPDGVPRTGGGAWRIGWDMRTYEMWPGARIAAPLTCATRRELGAALSDWLTVAIRESALTVAIERQAEIEEATNPVADPYDVMRMDLSELPMIGDDFDPQNHGV